MSTFYQPSQVEGRQFQHQFRSETFGWTMYKNEGFGDFACGHVLRSFIVSCNQKHSIPCLVAAQWLLVSNIGQCDARNREFNLALISFLNRVLKFESIPSATTGDAWRYFCRLWNIVIRGRRLLVRSQMWVSRGCYTPFIDDRNCISLCEF